MKHTQAESHAMTLAKTITPMTDTERAALPAGFNMWTPEQRRQGREMRLFIAAEALDRRELRNRLYRHAVQTGDRSGIRDYRVTALDRSTARLRSDLVFAYRQLLQLDAAQKPVVAHE